MGTGAQSALQSADVYLLAENRLVRETLARFLRKRTGIRVVGVQSTTESAIEDIFTTGCEVVLTDSLSIFRHNNFLDNQAKHGPVLKTVLFGMDDDPSIFWQAACFGVGGYLLKDASANEIFDAVRAVIQGEAVCPPRLCMTLIRRLAQRSRTDGAESHSVTSKSLLTHRQMQLVNLVARGMTNKEIATNLNLSEFTVKNHIHRIMRQVDANSRHHAAEMILAQQQF
jgi:DNA-binding NarL/FixJ family response regulator